MLIGHLDAADLGVLLGYFVAVFAVGIWVIDLSKINPSTSSRHAEIVALLVAIFLLVDR